MAVTTEARVHSNMHRWNLAMLACLFAVLTQCGGNGHCKFISEDFDLLSIHPEHLNERLCPFRPHLWPTNGEIGYNFPSIIRCPIGLAPVLAGNPFSSCCSPESVLISRNIDTPEKTPEYVGFWGMQVVCTPYVCMGISMPSSPHSGFCSLHEDVMVYVLGTQADRSAQ